MSEFDPEQFEAELESLRPAKPPQGNLNRILVELAVCPKYGSAPAHSQQPDWRWRDLLRWLVPTAASATVVVILFAKNSNAPQKLPQNRQTTSAAPPSLKADKVEIDRQLVADFDAIGRLPSGEPVRFRCQQWRDKVWLRDSAAGLVIERTTPRLEIVPVQFETY